MGPGSGPGLVAAATRSCCCLASHSSKSFVVQMFYTRDWCTAPSCWCESRGGRSFNNLRWTFLDGPLPEWQHREQFSLKHFLDHFYCISVLFLRLLKFKSHSHFTMCKNYVAGIVVMRITVIVSNCSMQISPYQYLIQEIWVILIYLCRPLLGGTKTPNPISSLFGRLLFFFFGKENQSRTI